MERCLRVARRVLERGFGQIRASRCASTELLSVGGIGQAGSDIVFGKVWEVVQNFLSSHATSKIGENIVDGNPHPANAGLAPALTGFEGYDLRVIH